ncbi:MAG: hypothetical protein WDO24_27635 [Pseudomonadota bacterium]
MKLARRATLTVYSQDDPAFPETVADPIDDTALEVSHRLKIEIVPTPDPARAWPRGRAHLRLGRD